VLLAQALVVAAGAGLSRRIPTRPPVPLRPAGAGEYLAGLRIVLASPLRAVLALTCGIGFSASYNVVLPVLVREVHGGDIRDVSLVMLTFPVGTILGCFVLLSRGGIRRKGRALVLSLALGAASVIASGLGLPFPAVVAAGLVWELAGGPHALPGARARRRARARAGGEPSRLHGGGPARRAALGLRGRRARPARGAGRLRRSDARAGHARYAGE
jgi:hypothetical protein